MAVTVRGKNLEVTPALREYVEKNVSKLSRFFTNPMDVQAVLSVEKETRVVEITCFVDSIVLRGVDANTDMYAAIDLVFDKLVRQVHKYKTKLAKRYKKGAGFKGDSPEFSHDIMDDVPEDRMEVVRRKSFDVHPMDIEEAILQMNLVGHDFFVFFNAATEMVNVVYKRRNGMYGLIEPKF